MRVHDLDNRIRRGFKEVKCSCGFPLDQAEIQYVAVIQLTIEPPDLIIDPYETSSAEVRSASCTHCKLQIPWTLIEDYL